MKKFFIVSLLFLLTLIGLFFVLGKLADESIDRAYAEEIASWPNAKYATVKGFLYNLNDPAPGTLHNPNILEDGKLVSSVVDKNGVELSSDQIQRLISSVSKIPPHSGIFSTISSSMCVFDPHHAFVFYNSQGAPVATIEICTICQDVVVSPDRKLDYEHDFDGVVSLLKELNFPVFDTYAEFDAYRKKQAL